MATRLRVQAEAAVAKPFGTIKMFWLLIALFFIEGYLEPKVAGYVP